MRIQTITAVLAIALMLGLIVALAITVSAETNGFLSVSGRWIVDSTGKSVLLRGVNYPGYASLDSEGGLTIHSMAAYRAFAQAGFNVVRLPISWQFLEPMPGIFNIAYLINYVDRDVQWANEYGLHVVLDMHQFNWAEKFNGSGVPDWMVQRYAATDAGLREAVSDFWANSSLQAHLSGVWMRIAEHYADEPTIAGYDILNEPWIYTSVIPYLNATYVDAFYLQVTKSIRAVDPNHIIFLEPANMNTFKLLTQKNIVWSPHFYTLAFAPKYYPQNITILNADLAAKYKIFVNGTGVPMWIGEFGDFMKDGSSRDWLQDAISLFNKYQVGWAWWAYEDKGISSIPSPLYSPFG